MCWLFCVCVIFFTFATSDSTLIDKLSKIKWHCADENCSAPISEGYGLRLYNGDDPIKLNFNQNDHFLILGKTNDDKFDQYWLVQAGDRKGIVPVQFVRERKVIINKVNQIETELDLSSIIRPIENERTANEAIKPSSPSLVIDGTTLPPYDEDPISLEAVVEDYSEEVDYESYSEPQAKENPLFGAFGGPGPIPSDSLETDANQNANYTGTGEGFNSDKVASIDSGNVDDVKDSTKSQSDNESSGIQNSIDEKSSGTEASQDLVSNEVGTVHVGSVSENSQDQNVVINSEISSDVNETESNQALAGDVKVESTAENVTYNFNNVVEEKKVDSLEDEKKDPVNVLTNTQNFDASNEPQPTVPPQQPIEQYSTTADQQLVSEKENPLNAEAHITQPPTAEVPRTESPVSSNVVTLTEQAPPVEGIQLQSASPDQNIPPILETITPAVEVAVVPQSETGSRIETYSPSPQPESPLSDSEQDKESVPVSPSEVRDSYVDQLSHPGDGLLSSFTPPIRKDEQPVPEVPSPTVPSLSLHTSYGSIPTENIQPIISPELPTSSIPVSSMPASDPTAKYDSPIIPNIYNQVNSNEDYSLNDTGSSVDENHLSPEQENLITSTEGYVAGTVSELPIVDPQVLNQPRPEESVPETIPTDNSVKEDKDGEDNSAYITQTDELANVIQEGEGWFSGISSVMGSFTEMFSKSDIGVDREDVKTSSEEPVTSTERSESQESGGEEKHCFTESCGQQSTNNEAVYNESNDPGYVSAMFGSFFPESEMSFSTFLCMIITSVVVLLFSLGYYYLENLKQDTSLVSKINTVSTELFFAQKELASIEEQYQLANENYRKLVSETSNNETAIVELRKELEESKAARGALEDEIKRLEKEIESLVEEGDEMHRMLAESFSEEERTKSLLANISDLKSVLSDRLQEIVSLTEQLDKEKQEVELLTISLKKSEEKREATEDKLTKVLIDADSKTLAVTKEFEEKITTLERIIEERSLERTNFEKQICELKGTCESLVVEKELAEKELKKAHGVSSGKALSEWLEAKSIRTDLLTAQKEAEKLSEALEQAKNQGALLEEKEKQLLNQIEELNNKYESAEKDKIEALTKLQVLSNYFKEKEIQLQEELGIKESQWLQKQSEDHTIYEQMRSLREENLSYKAQNEALKKEIIDQEASFKIQIANEEQKAQENWINLRHTERRLKEVQMEASHLRSRLTALEANPDSLEDKHKSLEMVNGDVSMGAASPPFMLYPPPDYIPPPPLVSPTRPPPLGRLSSPPLTPPAPLSPFEFYPPPPASPPPPLRVHKPQPREPHRKQKDSQSSNHSSESTEKPIRRGKR